MATLDLDDYPEAREWLEQGRKFIRKQRKNALVVEAPIQTPPALSLTSIVERAIKGARASVNESMLAELPLRFPVQVQNKQTRVYLEYQAKALGTSIAALAGLILDQVVQVSLGDEKPAANESSAGCARF